MSFRGIFLTSERPAETARFYRDIGGIPLEAVGSVDTYQYWKCDDGRMQLAIHDARAFADYTFPPRAESNLTHLYFHIAEQAAFLTHIRTLGIVPHVIDDVTVTLTDPDGRKVLFGTAQSDQDVLQNQQTGHLERAALMPRIVRRREAQTRN